MDQRADFFRIGPFSRDGNEVIFQLTQIVIETIGRWGFEKTPKAFHWIEFRTVGRQRQQPNIGRQALIAL